MKKIVLICLSLFIISCEDVIDVDLPQTEPRLSVDALIRVDTNSPQSLVKIKTTIAAGFFDEIQPNTEPLNITLTNESTGELISFEEDIQEPGTYLALNSNGASNNGFIASSTFQNTTDNWLLSFSYQNQIYNARTQAIAAPVIDSIYQGDNTLFEDEGIEAVVAFTDFDTPNNYYLFDFDFNEYLTTEDTFYNGQQFIFSYFYDSLIVTENSIDISIMGIDQQFYNYLNQILALSNTDGGPFQTPVSTTRGNILNTTAGANNTDVDDFVLGYFAISHQNSTTLILE